MPLPELSPRTAKILPWLVSMAFFMQMLNNTIVNTALPTIAKELGESPLNMQSVIIAYLITCATLIPASGWLADRFGTRRIFLSAILLFAMGSLACAFSQDLTMLVFSRVLQGVGGALLLPVGRLIVLRSYPRKQLIQLLSFITMATLIGSLLGPVISGFVVEYASWHWVFLIDLPVGVTVFILSWHYMPEIKEDNCPRFDKFGFILFALAMLLLTFGLEGRQEALSHQQMFVLIGAGFACFVVYWIKSFFSVGPLFSPHMFKIRSFSIGIVGNFLSRLGTGAMPFFLPLLLQVAMGYSPSHTGLLMIPLSLAAIFTKSITPFLVRKFGYKIMLVTNTVALGLSICLLALLGNHSSIPLIFGLFLIMGAVNAMQLTAINTLTLADLPDKYTASGNSLLSASLQLSIGFGVSVVATLLQNFESIFGLAENEIIKAFHYTFICIGGVTFLSTIPFLLIKSSCGKEVFPK